jgi:hypothetical protein
VPYKEGSEFTTIGIRKTTRDRLKEIGKKGDWYDDVVQRLLELYEVHPEEFHKIALSKRGKRK